MSRPSHPVLVTGGAGFIGSHLCEELVRRGEFVVCLDDLSTGTVSSIERLRDSERFTFLRADLVDGVPLQTPISALLHCAAPCSVGDFLARPRQSLGTLTSGTLAALEFAASHRAPFVLVSTPDAAACSSLGEPSSAYRAGRHLAETSTAAYRTLFGLPTTILRVFATIGPRMRHDAGLVIPDLIRRALQDEPLVLVDGGSRAVSVCFVADVVRGIIDAADGRMPGPIDLGGAPRALALLARQVLSAAGSTRGIAYAPFPGRPSLEPTTPDTELTAELLGWRAEVSPDDALARTVAALRSKDITV